MPGMGALLCVKVPSSVDRNERSATAGGIATVWQELEQWLHHQLRAIQFNPESYNHVKEVSLRHDSGGPLTSSVNVI